MKVPVGDDKPDCPETAVKLRSDSTVMQSMRDELAVDQ